MKGKAVRMVQYEGNSRINLEVPQDRESTFEPAVVKKRQKDISNS